MKNYLILFSILIVAIFIRFYNFSDRITFGPEQARSLMVSANYIDDKPSLLGQEYFRANSLGHKLFASAIFNYTLVPLLLVTNYDPYQITIYFALLNIFTGFVLFILSKRMFNKEIAIIALLLFLFNNYMIYHSMFIWILNYLPLLGILSLYLIWKIYKQNFTLCDKEKYNTWDILILGILSGIGFGLEYLYVLAIFIILGILIRYSKNKLQSIFLFTLGGVIGDFTQVIFDIRHDFYHFRALYQYALDTFSGKSDAGFIYYHFLEFWPVVILFLSYLLWLVYKRNKIIFFVLLVLYLFINLSSTLINLEKPVGMVDGFKYQDIKSASKLIADNAKPNFNLVTLYDFDTRGYTLRYFVKYVYNKPPLNEIDYQGASEIYALAKDDYDFSNNNPWELNVYKPYNIESLDKIGEGYRIFKLTKTIK